MTPNRVLLVVIVLALVGCIAAFTYRAVTRDDVPDRPCVSDIVDACEDQTYPS